MHVAEEEAVVMAGTLTEDNIDPEGTNLGGHSKLFHFHLL